MSEKIIHGLLAPLLTPFEDDLQIATDLYVQHAKRVLAQGCAGVVPFGTTGEALSVSIDERIAAIKSMVDSGVDPAKMIPGTGVSNLADTARLSRACLDLGCNAVLVLPPFYFKAVSDAGLYEYFARLVDAVGHDAKIVLYHIPPIAVVGISPGLAARLHADFPQQIIGIKDSSGDWDNTRALLEIEGLTVYPGSELTLLDAMKLGAPGCISATANVNAAAIAQVAAAFLSGDVELAEKLHRPVREFRQCLQEYAPIPAQKRLLALASGDERWAGVRPPLLPMTADEGRKLAGMLRRDFGFDIKL
jgi:4-hydroxy-tetrahydrodipicolinate synthase